MQLSDFKRYASKVVSEGDRLQRYDNTGKKIARWKFTDSQIFSGIVAAVAVWLLPCGFTDNFAGYVSGFLGIFVGLFTTVVMSMEEKSKTLYANWDKIEEIKKPKIEITRNYMVRFTGLTSYSILLALVVIVLLLLTLSGGVFSMDIGKYPLIHSFNEFDAAAFGRFVLVVIAVLHRFFTVYFLFNFFAITIFSTTSYFSRILSDYNDLKPPDAKP
jgi:hypothetical protein